VSIVPSEDRRRKDAAREEFNAACGWRSERAAIRVAGRRRSYRAGSHTLASKITVYRTGLRSATVLNVNVGPAERAPIKTKLGVALAGFEFATRIEVPLEDAVRQ
jgi:hypothetical protein